MRNNSIYRISFYPPYNAIPIIIPISESESSFYLDLKKSATSASIGQTLFFTEKNSFPLK